MNLRTYFVSNLTQNNVELIHIKNFMSVYVINFYSSLERMKTL